MAESMFPVHPDREIRKNLFLPFTLLMAIWVLGRVVGYGIARANQKSIVFVPRDPTNPQKLVLEVGNHRQFGLLALLL